MKKLSSALRRLQLLAATFGGSAPELGKHDSVSVRVLDPRCVRIIGRMALLAVAIVSLPWLGAALLGSGETAFGRPMAINNDDGTGFLRVLLDDMRSRGLIDLEKELVVLRDPVASNEDLAMPDGSADFIFSAATDGFDRIDRILKDGGLVAFRLSPELHPPANYRTAYVGHVGAATIIAMNKYGTTTSAGRRSLLALPEKKKEALNGLEDVLLEPPRRQRSRGHWRKTKYLPELTGDSLDEYPKRVFMEVVPRGDEPRSTAAWFDRHYPKKDRAFEVMQLVVVEEEKGSKSSIPSATTTGIGVSSPQLASPAEWLERNVKEEDYVVLKAEAEVVEEMLAKGSVRLVDELFLQCRHQWGKKKRERSRRAYWECLALYGKLRDKGVAVHQWWGS